jgi:hypothetical protein
LGKGITLVRKKQSGPNFSDMRLGGESVALFGYDHDSAIAWYCTIAAWVRGFRSQVLDFVGIK